MSHLILRSGLSRVALRRIHAIANASRVAFAPLQQRGFAANTSASAENSTDPLTDEVLKAAEASPPVPPAPQPEVKKASMKKREFQTETRQLLDIVTNSLYTDREVFVRELVSNASDALEKMRFLESTNAHVMGKDTPLEISISTDENSNTITFQDSGLGMTDTELVENLGTIARSGSKQFLKSLQAGQQPAGHGEGPAQASAGTETSIIGRFGVGFYSAFMVCDKVEVFSQSYKGGSGYYWVSDGTGDYEIAEASNVQRGTKIVLHLKQNAKEFSIRHNIERILKKYSNFVGFPIRLNNERVNSIRALWLDDKSSITQPQYEEFYRYIANAFDKPRYTQHFHTDAPLSIHALFFVPDNHTEKAGLGRMEPGVNLYSRKVLIQPKSPVILPDWLRFLRGVVDSEDIPLNISRETMQDSALIKRIRSVLTKKAVSFFESEGRRDPVAYNKFFDEFGSFLKEGIIADPSYKDSIARLLRFESSRFPAGQVSSLDDYISRMPSQQKHIHYLCMPSRAVAEASPYFEQFKAQNIEVLFLYTQLDELALKSLEEYSRRKLVSIESSDAEADLPSKKDLEAKAAEEEAKAAEENKNEDGSAKDGKADSSSGKQNKLTGAQAQALIKWMERSLSSRVSSVKLSTRLVSSPAIITDHESASVRRLLHMMGDDNLLAQRKQKLEINPSHPIIVRLASVAKLHPERATMVAEQIFDNAMIAAGLMDDPRVMLGRLNSILEASLTAPTPAATATAASADASTPSSSSASSSSSSSSSSETTSSESASPSSSSSSEASKKTL